MKIVKLLRRVVRLDEIIELLFFSVSGLQTCSVSGILYVKWLWLHYIYDIITRYVYRNSSPASPKDIIAERAASSANVLCQSPGSVELLATITLAC